MKKIEIIIGSTYGRWTILEEVESKNGERQVRCSCSCGTEKIVRLKNIRYGKSLSCGCLNSENTSKRNKINKKHGKYGIRLYRIWQALKQRCQNSNSINHKYYFDKNIKICDEWKSDFISFYNWAINNGYSDSLTIDRIDNNKGYCPENCRWATIKEQQRNKTNNVKTFYNGVEMTAAEISEITGKNYNKILKMIKSNTFTLCFFCLFLFSCSHIDANFCPTYPVAGEKVAKELEAAGELPYTWEWIGRIDKLRRELELCR